jgi:hypothetical protein
VEFDSVAKQCVLDRDVNDGKTLQKDFAKDPWADNGCETVEYTVMKATWLSKVDAMDGGLAKEQSRCGLSLADRDSYVWRDRCVLSTVHRQG